MHAGQVIENEASEVAEPDAGWSSRLRLLLRAGKWHDLTPVLMGSLRLLD